MRLDLENRRRFLQFLAGSPLLGSLPAMAWQKELTGGPASPKDVVNIMDLEEVAHKAIPPAHWGYLATGVDDDATLKANHEAYKHIQLRPRRLADVRTIDTRVDLFGTTWESPIFLCPVGSQRAFHGEGELGTARAAKSKRTLQILSTMTSTGVEDVCAARGTPVWYQLYSTSRWEIAEKLVKRAEAAGCPALVWTVDLQVGRNTETQRRFTQLDTRQCSACHGEAPPGSLRRKIMFAGMDVNSEGVGSPEFTWEYVDRLKKMTRMKLLLKGIETREDAKLCVEHGVDGIVVSNHGGRAEESGRATIECLPEVVDAVGGRIPVLIDGGIRRGTDVFKALALGARAVGIGRPYIWGLAAFGQPGVERVVDILRTEFELTMRQCGARSLAEITRTSVVLNSGMMTPARG
jgi:isopentenyl diphosphate isomerase/L-lactate dehydrogenase-like FMN-dependent dehydrogenase